MSTRSPIPPRDAPHQLWRGVHATLRSDALGGILLLAATAAALVLANSPALAWYQALRDTRIGPAELHLNLTLGQWAAEGLLAVFFFVVGLELKEEFVHGRLRSPRTAALPIAAAVGGVAVPALIFIALTAHAGPDAMRGWAIPSATDIAFAIAVLAVVGRFLPPALRVFLLTLAIVDDLLAISIIAVFYTDDIQPLWLAAALIPLALFAAAVQRGVRAWWLLIPLAVTCWAFVHEAGVHATVAGAALGFVVPVAASARASVLVGVGDDGVPLREGLAPHFADRWGVVATLGAVPAFAFFAAGVPIGGVDGLLSALRHPIALAIIAGLVLGKPIGILGATWLLSRLPAFRLDPELRWPDLTGMSLLAGIGFTVSLLVGELAYEGAGLLSDVVTIGVLCGSLLAAVGGGAVLARRSQVYRRRAAAASSVTHGSPVRVGPPNP